ncbi:uncharacterized protein LOC132309767 [Cornus florida]|uniref:uncharacterized protein LOC132309767 n=1 Tax=Cornus florida TaxID=4283 RepID=UPI0028A13896|nr:uncharacterized protein LOC132309767 [Cornus florida]
MSGAGRGRGRPARGRGQGGVGRGGVNHDDVQLEDAPHVPNPMIGFIRDIRKLGAVEFARATDPLDAEKWIEDMEKYFEMMDCTEVQKRKIGAFLLSGEARQWWQSETRMVVDITTMTWDDFKTRFNDKYFPQSVKEKKVAEFTQLEQNNEMSVSEYERKFTELSRFAPHIVANELHKVRKFERGLVSYVKKFVVGHRFDTYARVVECAMAVEENNNIAFQKQKERRAEQKGKGASSTQQNQSSSQQNQRGQQQQTQRNWQGQSWQRGKQDWRAGKRQRVGEGEQSTALVPATPHDAQPYQFSGHCYNCREQGHLARNCPKPHKNNQQKGQAPQQQGGARVYAVVPDGRQDRAPPAVEGTLTIYGSIGRVLFDSGSSYSFIALSFVNTLGLEPGHISNALSITTPLGSATTLDRICRACPVTIGELEYPIDLIVLRMREFDAILGMDWLARYHAQLNCHERIIVFSVPGQFPSRYKCGEFEGTMTMGFLAHIEEGSGFLHRPHSWYFTYL